MIALLRVLSVCLAVTASAAAAPAQRGLDLLPPIGPAPAGTLPLFERFTVTFSPPEGSTLTDLTEMTERVTGPRSSGSFYYVFLLVRDDGAHRVTHSGGRLLRST